MAYYKAQISGKVTSGISDVVTASVHSEKTRMKKCSAVSVDGKELKLCQLAHHPLTRASF